MCVYICVCIYYIYVYILYMYIYCIYVCIYICIYIKPFDGVGSFVVFQKFNTTNACYFII